MADREKAISVAIDLIKDYCNQIESGLWEQIVNQNPVVNIPIKEAFDHHGIKMMEDGSANMSDLLNVTYAKSNDKGSMGNPKFKNGKKPSELTNQPIDEMRKDTEEEFVKELHKGMDTPGDRHPDEIMDECLNNDKETNQDLKRLIQALDQLTSS